MWIKAVVAAVVLTALASSANAQADNVAAQTLAQRSNIVPKKWMDACMDKPNEAAIVACLDVLLLLASESTVKDLHYFEMVKNGKMVGRYWTLPICMANREPGSICINR